MQYPLSTLLVFDSRQHALPVAWIITRTVAKPDVAKWMKALLGRVREVDSGWKVNGFLIDDAAVEIDPIRQNTVFGFLYSLVMLSIFTFNGTNSKCFSGRPFLALSYFPSGVFVGHG